eukprot:gene16237-17873_t
MPQKDRDILITVQAKKSSEMTCFKFSISLSDTESRVAFALVCFVLMFLSVFGNSIVIYVVWTRPRLHNSTFSLIFSLALSDLFTAIFGQTTFTNEVALTKHETSCTTDKIIAFLHATSCSVSLMLLAMISRDRYLRVSRKFANPNVKHVVVITILFWIVGMGMALLLCFEQKFLHIAGTSCFAVNGLVCFTAICVLNKCTRKVVQRHFDSMEQSMHSNNPGGAHDTDDIQNIRNRKKQEQKRMKCEKSVNRSILAIIIIYSIAWFPVIIMMLIFTALNFMGKDINPRMRIGFLWASLMSYFNGAINPFIYAYRSDEIGKDIRSFLANVKSKMMGSSSVSPISITLTTRKD